MNGHSPAYIDYMAAFATEEEHREYQAWLDSLNTLPRYSPEPKPNGCASTKPTNTDPSEDTSP